MRFIDKVSAILLDMNGSFMFGHDRFGPEEDYWSTYRSLGGTFMDRDTVLRVIHHVYDSLTGSYDRPERFEDFPSLAECFLELEVPEAEASLLESVFAAHEIGYVPDRHEAFLREIAKTHHLGIVSNLFARPEPWLASFRESGLLPVFKTLVFSSEERCIKPSSKLFQRALAELPPGAAVLFAGDSLERDILPAKALKLFTAWIAPAGSKHPAADVVVASLPELAELAAEAASTIARPRRR